MKKTIRTILCAAFFAALAVSCQKEIEEVKPLAGIKETIEISINGLMGEYNQVDATKSSLVNTVRVSWTEGDIVYVFDKTKCLGSLEASLDGTEDRYAMLSGSIEAPASGNTLYLVHSPLLTAKPVITNGKLSISLSEQITDKAPFVVYSTLDYTEEQTNMEGLIVLFSFATSVIRVNCTGLKPGTAISSANISGVNTSCVLSFDDGTVTASGADKGIITRLSANGFDSVNAEGDASFLLAVPALSSSTSGRTLTINQGKNEYLDENFSTSDIAPSFSVNTICTMISRDTITPYSLIGTIGTIDGRKAVVVNLNGTKYAVALRNEGATADRGPDSYGDCYEFEEAATFFHGSDINVWRVPTMDEMKALADLTLDYDGITPAIKFMSMDVSINFPLAGMYLSSEQRYADVGTNGYYYTSTPSEGGEVFLVSCLSYQDGQPSVIYVANPDPESNKLSLRLLYKLTETGSNYLPGVFSVSKTKKVHFSKGNLWAGSDNALHFEDAQWKFTQTSDGSTVSGHISHFTWSDNVVSAVGSSNSGNNLFCDENHKVSVDDNGAIYYALSADEWQYLFENHSFKGVTVNGVGGYIIAPDDFAGTIANSYDDDAALAGDNLVFLPASGSRIDFNVFDAGGGFYWSSSASGGEEAYNVYFNSFGIYYSGKVSSRKGGYSVRLVTDVE